MKELAFPHNDWWTSRRALPFRENQPSEEVREKIEHILNGESFAELVKDGIEKLEQSPSYLRAKSELSLKAQLRPLFCETEINLESSLTGIGERPDHDLRIPSASVLNPLLGQSNFSIKQLLYERFLKVYGMKFPETTAQDADHSWLVPVKGHSDLVAIKSLIDRGVIDEEFALDVLSIDFEQPLFSTSRCALLKLVPETGEWKQGLLANLNLSPLDSALELAENLESPLRNGVWHLNVARLHPETHRARLNSNHGAGQEFERLLKMRKSVFESVISKNPRGQILEPGFRVIFPEAQQEF